MIIILIEVFAEKVLQRPKRMVGVHPILTLGTSSQPRRQAAFRVAKNSAEPVDRKLQKIVRYNAESFATLSLGIVSVSPVCIWRQVLREISLNFLEPFPRWDRVNKLVKSIADPIHELNFLRNHACNVFTRCGLRRLANSQ